MAVTGYTEEEIKMIKQELDNLRLVYGGCQSDVEVRECNRKIKHAQKELARVNKQRKAESGQTSWNLIEIHGTSRQVVKTFDSHKQAKNALWIAKKRAEEDFLDLEYEIEKA